MHWPFFVPFCLGSCTSRCIELTFLIVKLISELFLVMVSLIRRLLESKSAFFSIF